MIRHVAGLAEIVDDIEGAIHFYRTVLGLEVREQAPGYAVVTAPGLLHFGVWARSAAAESIFGDAERAGEISPGFTVAFEVDSVNDAHAELGGAGASVLQPPKTEPWGQRTCRFLLPSGGIGEVSETPWARRLETDVAGGEGEEGEGVTE